MSDLRASRGFRSAHRRSPLLALLAVVSVLPSCSDDGGTSPDIETQALDGDGSRDSACLWETDDLLSRVDAAVPKVNDCGLFLGQQPLDNDCFTEGMAAGSAVQITINNCTDCMIHSTYVSTPGAGKFHLYREADYYGDATRVVRVDSCTDFVAGEGSGANCVEPVILYACSDPLPDPSRL